ncbi:MAG: hypothetical protein ACXVCY_08790 [Pseudobdellovibrionaceae bacterium]
MSFKGSIIVLYVCSLFLSLKSYGQVDSRNDGNHGDAKSESWTWMGFLNEVTTIETGFHQLEIKNSNNGLAVLHYYTRNDAGIGNLTFRSSAITRVENGIGKAYFKKTTYSANTEDFQLKIDSKKLGIQLIANQELDKIEAVPMSEQDTLFLETQLLPLYPGLKVSPSFQPTKSTFQVHSAAGVQFSLTLYNIWAPISPPNMNMEFLGVQNTNTFTYPMQIAYGDKIEKGVVTKMAGLFFVDRQWSSKYFGSKVFQDPTAFTTLENALPYAHHWSAFHGFDTEKNEWIFVHTWQQYLRKPHQADKKISDSNILWVKNGDSYNRLEKNNFNISSNNFARGDQSRVLINFTKGRKAYFPTQYHMESNTGDVYNLTASPAIQTLDQPIYLYEGYAQGKAFWKNQNYQIRGRVESSRILFRDQDYHKMIADLSTSQENRNGDTQIQNLTQEIKSALNESHCNSLFDVVCLIEKEKMHWAFLLNDMSTKINILSKQLATHYSVKHLKSADHEWWIYY